MDGDGRAELVVLGNNSDKGCSADLSTADPTSGRPAWVGSDGAVAPYRGLAVFRDSANGWVGTRTLWNQHAYSVVNVCGDRGACAPGAGYGSIPMSQPRNWEVGFLNNFRQNVQGEGIFNAPDATVGLRASCDALSRVLLTASVRNLGSAILPEGVTVDFYVVEDDGTETLLGQAMTTGRLFPGQVAELELDSGLAAVDYGDNAFFARIRNEGASATFRECRDDNNESPRVMPACLL
jgi:hypothetical protein